MPAKPKFHDWPASLKIATPAKIIEAYQQGFAGVYDDPEERGKFDDWIRHAGGGYTSADDVAHNLNFAGVGEGQLILPFVNVLELFPTALPGAAQRRGDCVSHSTVYAALLTMCCEIARGKPDEVTGQVEGVPDVPEGGVDDAVLSSESVYWWRDHGGDGWSCDHASRVVCTESGLWLRKNYPEFGIDLTRYSAKTAGKWGAKNPPAEIKAFGQSHLVRVATRINSFESLRDFTAMGVGVSTCGGEGWSSKRDENGVSKRSGSWAHAIWGNAGVDDRPWAHETYGEPLIAMSNSWGTWNSGPRDIHDSAGMVPAGKKAEWIRKGIVNPETGNIMLPHGAWWAKWSDVRRRSMIALGGVAGWPRSPVDNLLI